MTQSPLSDFSALYKFDPPELPSETHELFQLFASSSHHLVRICALAKIKQQLICSLPEFIRQPPSQQTSQAVQILVSRHVLNFISKTKKDFEVNRSGDDIGQMKASASLFYQVVSMAVKYFFREDAIKGLLGEVTELLEGHPERVKPALFLFTQIMSTIEKQPSDLPQNTSMPRCLFERYFYNEHINSMLALGNYCLQRGILQEGLTLQDGPTEDLFFLLAPEQTLAAALRLVRTCLCFDWNGEKNRNLEDEEESKLLLVPIKRGKFSANDNEFERWLKNTDWINLYLFIFKESQSKQLKIQTLQLLGDLARTHLKFFKTKQNYKIYIQGISHAFVQSLEALIISRNNQDTIEVALVLGSNLNKLLNLSTRSVLFEINPNIIKALLESVKRFIVGQIIGEEIFNSNVLFFYFKFLEGILNRSRFQKNKLAFDIIDQLLRQICRSYQHYIRVLFNGIRRTPIRLSESFQYRKDYSKLKEAIIDYDWKQMSLYFLPFRLMKPRYFSTNTIYELFIYLCARVYRAVSLLEMFKMQPWEIEVAYQMIIQAVSKIKQRFELTTYKKPRVKRQLQNDSQSGDLASIDEQFGEQIQNEEEYCHMLRLCLFMILQEFIDKTPMFLLKLNCQMIQTVKLCIELCFCADLQDADSQQMKKMQIKRKIQQGLEMCPQILKKVVQRQYDKMLTQTIKNQMFRVHPVRYRSNFLYSDLDYIDFQLQNELIYLSDTISKIFPSIDQNFKHIFVQMSVLIKFTIPEQFSKSDQLIFQSIKTCLFSIQTLTQMEVLVQLIKCKHKRMFSFLEKVLQWIQTRQCQDRDILPTLKILRKIAELKVEIVSQLALNKLFVALKFLLPSLKQAGNKNQDIIEELNLIADGTLSSVRQADFEHLSSQIKKLVLYDQKKTQPMDLEDTCLNISLSYNANASFQEPQNIEISYENVEPVQSQNQSKPIDEQIYPGYHSDQTMKVLQKYIDLEEDTNGQNLLDAVKDQVKDQQNNRVQNNPETSPQLIPPEPTTLKQNRSQNDQKQLGEQQEQLLLNLQPKSQLGSPEHPSTPTKEPLERSLSNSNRQLLLVSSNSSSQQQKVKNDQT